MPGRPAPPLEFTTLAGDTWKLAGQRPERFTMVVFYRGLHCPVCKSYLSELAEKAGAYRERGVEPVVVSGDAPERAAKASADWGLGVLVVGHSLPTATMRAWDLYVSGAITDDEPAHFNEPGLFLIAPDATVYYAAINSMAFGRPPLDEMLGAVDFVAARNYPARGTAAIDP